MREAYVYILSKGRHGSLYIGVTTDLDRRISEHRLKLIPGHASKHDITRLVHIETFGDIRDAITREKRLKKWNRDWKVRLIEEQNPHWEDLAISLLEMPHVSQKT
ncbi:MAG: GIY-YIG nuclease family protein [Pacificimonas sp.]